MERIERNHSLNSSSNNFICINCATSVNLSNSYGLTSQFKIRPNQRKRRKIPSAATWRNLQLTVSQALDVIFQVTDRHRGYIDVSTSRLCDDCMKVFNHLFQLYLEFISLSQNVPSIISNVLENTELIQRHLKGSLSRKEHDPGSIEQSGSSIVFDCFRNTISGAVLPEVPTERVKVEGQSVSAEEKAEVKIEQTFLEIPGIDCDEENGEDLFVKIESEPVGPVPKKKKKSHEKKSTHAALRQSIRSRKTVTKFDTNSNKQNSSKRSPKEYKCEICSEVYQTRKNFIGHAANHTEDQKYWCTACNCGFINSRILREHFFKIHPHAQIPGRTTTYSDFDCPVCPHKFVSPIRLKMHIVNKHFRCPTCQETTFLTIEEINSHMTGQHGPDWLKVVCDLCGYKTLEPKLLRRHRLLVHSLGEAKFTCEVCGKKVPTQSSLRNHQATHSDERPIKCNLCDMTYKKKNSLQYHMSAIHDGIRYICEICGHASSSETNLRKHVDGVHHGIKQTQKRAPEEAKRKRFRVPTKGVQK